MDSCISSLSSIPKQKRIDLLNQLLNQMPGNPCRILMPSGKIIQCRFNQMQNSSILFESKRGEHESINFSACTGFSIRLKSKKIKTDSEISKSGFKNRKLENWPTDGPELTLESDTGKWDQFEVNNKKFGVVSTYDEEIYTTKKVKEDQLTREQVIRAKIIEDEIMNKEHKEESGDDEEKMFGAVLGSGRFAQSSTSETSSNCQASNSKSPKVLKQVPKKSESSEIAEKKHEDPEQIPNQLKPKESSKPAQKSKPGRLELESREQSNPKPAALKPDITQSSFPPAIEKISDIYFEAFLIMSRDNTFAVW